MYTSINSYKLFHYNVKFQTNKQKGLKVMKTDGQKDIDYLLDICNFRAAF